jgi:small subunit ribosomal protein S16
VRFGCAREITCNCRGPERASPERVDVFEIELESFVIKLRLRRMGAKKRPSYRIVAADSRSKRDGRIIEQIGFYDPLTEPATVTLNEERAAYWLSVGAQPTETVHILLRNQGLLPDDRAERAAAHAKPAAS